MADAFIGGEFMSKKLKDMMESLGLDHGVRVGFLENSHAGKDNDESAPTIAFINEYGAPGAGIPSRPFFRMTVNFNSHKWGAILKAALKNLKYDSEKALGTLGLVIGEQLQNTIQNNVEPANAESTTKRKKFKGGSAMTLRDSKNMMRSISFEVDKLGQNKVNEGAE